MKFLVGAALALSLMAGTAFAGECTPGNTYDSQLASLEEAVGGTAEIIKVGPGAGLDALDALLATDAYAGRDIDFDQALVVNGDTMQFALVGLFKDGCYVMSGPLTKSDYFTLLPTIQGV